jgi:hypothetical protein
MDFQTVIVVFIILAALAFAGYSLLRKVGAFKPRPNSCGADCGCGKK